MAQRSQQDIAYHSKRCSLQIEVFLRNAVIRIITMPVCLPLDFGTATLKEVTPSPSADAATPGSKQGSLLQVTTVEIAGDSLSAPKRVTQGGVQPSSLLKQQRLPNAEYEQQQQVVSADTETSIIFAVDRDVFLRNTLCSMRHARRFWRTTLPVCVHVC
jgi:hypothetical protein